MNTFNFIKGFSRNENWGDPDKMNPFLLMLMEKVRAAFRLKYDPSASFVIHCGYEKDGHASGSQHGLGTADDFRIVTEVPFHMQVRAMITILADLGVSSYVGFGIYPDWKHPGFHLDVRMRMSRWGRIDKYRNKEIPGLGIFVPEYGYVSLEDALKYTESTEV